MPDVAEDFEQCFLSLDADAFGDPKRQLLYCRQHVVEDSLRSWGDVDEHPSPVVTIVAAHDVVLAFEIVEQGGHGATGDVHARGDFAGQHGMTLAFDDRERVQRGVREPVTTTHRADRAFDERADNLEFPGTTARQPACARELALECNGLGRPARRQGQASTTISMRGGAVTPAFAIASFNPGSAANASA